VYVFVEQEDDELPDELDEDDELLLEELEEETHTGWPTNRPVQLIPVLALMNAAVLPLIFLVAIETHVSPA
jgi:hypothetical protein